MFKKNWGPNSSWIPISAATMTLSELISMQGLKNDLKNVRDMNLEGKNIGVRYYQVKPSLH